MCPCLSVSDRIKQIGCTGFAETGSANFFFLCLFVVPTLPALLLHNELSSLYSRQT